MIENTNSWCSTELVILVLIKKILPRAGRSQLPPCVAESRQSSVDSRISVDIDIIPYKPYVELTYHNVQSLDQVVNKFVEVTNDPTVDSVEGIMYSLNAGVIMRGRFVEEIPKGLSNMYNAFGRQVEFSKRWC